MALTPGGTPYVEASDLVASYPATSLSLANKVDTKSNTDSPVFTGNVRNYGQWYYGPSENNFIGIAPNATTASSAFIARGSSATFQPNGVELRAGGTERLRIDSAGTILGTGSLGAWAAYTPVIVGAGWALGNGTITGKYTRIGKVVHFHILIVFGSTSTYGATGFTISLPLSRQPNETSYIGQVVDVSLGNSYLMQAITDTNTTLIINTLTGTALIQEIINTRPFTWASGDIIRFGGTYETNA